MRMMVSAVLAREPLTKFAKTNRLRLLGRTILSRKGRGHLAAPSRQEVGALSFPLWDRTKNRWLGLMTKTPIF
jgi:hypothetical protein